MEVWKDIEGYEGLYQVSNIGRVKSLKRYVQNHSGASYLVPERIKKASEKKERDKKQGYMSISLYKNNKGKSFYVHRLVAEAFVENPDNKETVNHINGDKHDNRAYNLEWCSYAENNAHAVKTGLNDSSHRRNRKGSMSVAQYDENMNLIAVYPSMREAERQTGIDCRSISLGIRKSWKYGGFIWKKAE
jgi:hypothetical protein